MLMIMVRATINEANTYRNQVVPRAKGEAASIIQRAEGYKATTVARARGDTQRFDQVYEQYNKARDITADTHEPFPADPRTIARKAEACRHATDTRWLPSTAGSAR